MSRDEALISIDGRPAVAAPSFLYPSFSPVAARGASAGICAAPGGGRTGGGLRGLLGPFAFLSVGLHPADVESTYEVAVSGRAFFELPHIARARVGVGGAKHRMGGARRRRGVSNMAVGVPDAGRGCRTQAERAEYRRGGAEHGGGLSRATVPS